MKQCTIHNESVSISSRDILTEILRQGAQEMLAQAINNEVAEYICLNHPRLKARREQGIAFGDGFSMSSPPSRSQMVSRTGSDGLAESGFGGWVNEKSRPARQVLPLLGSKEISSTTFDNTSLYASTIFLLRILLEVIPKPS